jgi:hypothetical protein
MFGKPNEGRVNGGHSSIVASGGSSLDLPPCAGDDDERRAHRGASPQPRIQPGQQMRQPADPRVIDRATTAVTVIPAEITSP